MLLGKVVRYSGETKRILILKEGSQTILPHTWVRIYTQKKLHKGWDFMYHKKSENSTDLRIMLFTAQEAV